MMLDDLQLFIRIVELGSLNAAAKHLSMPPATLTRRLQMLEKQLNCKLLHRNSRRLLPTQEGWRYYEQCQPLLQSLQEITTELDASSRQVAGTLRILAPITMANTLLLPVWQNLLQHYPELSLDLQLNNDMDDLLGRSVDLAIRVGEQASSSLNQRLLGWVSTVLVASPSYLHHHGTPNTLAELNQHTALLATPFERWPLQARSGGEPQLACWKSRLQVNDMLLALKLAEAAQGIAICPMILCHQQLTDGSLCTILPDWYIPQRPVYALWPQQRYMPARVRVSLDLLLEFAANSPLLAADKIALA